MKSKFVKVCLLSIAIIGGFNLAISAQEKSGLKMWNLVQIDGKNIEETKAFIELNKSDSRFTGNAGCNRMFGTFETKGNEVKFSGIGTTKMFCGASEVMKTEADFVRLLGEATRIKQKGNTLKIIAGDKLILKFKATNGSPAAVRLEDKKWILESIRENKPGKTSETAFLVFDSAKGSAGGNTGCNVFGGSYKAEGSNVKFTEIISTMRACIEDDGMNVERGFLDGLQNADRYVIKEGKLYLYHGETLLLSFRGESK